MVRHDKVMVAKKAILGMVMKMPMTLVFVVCVVQMVVTLQLVMILR